jgi:hypothetical protein
MKKVSLILAIAICSLVLHNNACAEDNLELEGATIIGNRELPKVLYIMPWKKAEPGDLVDRPINSAFDEVIAPVDRAVFRRELDYFKILNKPD